MLFRGPYIGNKSWKQSLLQFIQEIRNHVEILRGANSTGVDIPAARIVAQYGADAEVVLSDTGAIATWADGVTEEVIADGGRARVRYSGLVRCEMKPLEAVTAGLDVYVSDVAGLGTLVNAGQIVGRVYDASSYATDSTVILRLTCCPTAQVQ
jgi:hypothetical protein